MADSKRSYSSKQKSTSGLRRGSRGMRILLVLVEAVMAAVLVIGVYAVNLLGSMERSAIGKDDIYSYNGSNEVVVKALHTTEAPAVTEAPVPETTLAPVVAQVTEEVTEPETEWVIETQEIVTQEDFLAHQEIVNGYWNILILGVDATSGQPLSKGNYHGDVIIICSINVETKQIKLASVFRDTVVLQYGSDNRYDKATEMMFSDFGGGPLTMLSTINLNLDLNISDIVVVNWAAVALAVNELGGLYLTITEEEFNQAVIQGYLTSVVAETGIGSTQFTEPGYQWCDGPKVVAYCRNRYTTGNDYGRTSRQREVISLLLEQAKHAPVTNLINAVRICFSNIYTSLSIGDMMDLALDVGDYTVVDSYGFPESRVALKSMGGVMDPVIATSMASNVKALHTFLFGDTYYEPSQNVKTISDNISYLSGQQ